MMGNENAEIAFLLMMTPNVRDIWFTMPPSDRKQPPTFWFSKVFEQAQAAPPTVHPFGSLSKAFIHYWDQESLSAAPELGFPLSPFSAMVRLPTLETFDTIGNIHF
jgi:hypothetical protein